MLSCYYEMPVDRFLPGSLRLPVAPVKLSLLAETEDVQNGKTEDGTCEES
jgi:hypothetical protein